MDDPKKPFGQGPFPTTQWTVIIDVIQKGGDEAAFAALGNLFQEYRPAIRLFFQRRGLSEVEAAELTDSFFHSRIVEPWNRRHGFQPALYSEDDLKKLPLLATRLKRAQRPVACFLWNALSGSTRQMLEDSNFSREETKALRAALADDLNRLITGPSIYDTQRFVDVDLSVESRNLLAREPSRNWITWLNRSLLGDAFPGHFVKGIGFLYLVERKEQRKFRTFLAHALWCYRKDHARQNLTEKAGGGVPTSSLEQLDAAGHEVADPMDEKFGRDLDQIFALQLIRLAAQRSREKRSVQIEAHLCGEISQKEAADQLGISEKAFTVAYKRFRDRLALDLRAEVGKVVGPDKKEIEAEIRYLMSLVGK